MTQLQIQHFLAVADELSFSKAAEVLFVSQPAVSRNVSQLEKELGVPLFTRTNQGVVLTKAGEEFADFFRKSGKKFRQILEKAKKSADMSKGVLNIGCCEGWDLSGFFPYIKQNVMADMPELEMNLDGYNIDVIIPALERGDVDIIIAPEVLVKPDERMSVERITTRGGLLVFSANLPLAKKENLTLADFKKEHFYVTAPPTMIEAAVEVNSICAKEGFAPVIENVPSLSAAFMKLSSGSGVLFCNDWMIARNNPLFRSIPLDAPRDICLVWMEDNKTPEMESFIRETIQYFAHNN